MAAYGRLRGLRNKDDVESKETGAADLNKILAGQNLALQVIGNGESEFLQGTNDSGQIVPFLAGEDIHILRCTRITQNNGKPAHAQVVEHDWNTLGGIASAKAAGLKVVALPHTYRAEELRMADVVVASLLHLTVSIFQKL